MYQQDGFRLELPKAELPCLHVDILLFVSWGAGLRILSDPYLHIPIPPSHPLPGQGIPILTTQEGTVPRAAAWAGFELRLQPGTSLFQREPRLPYLGCISWLCLGSLWWDLLTLGLSFHCFLFCFGHSDGFLRIGLSWDSFSEVALGDGRGGGGPGAPLGCYHCYCWGGERESNKVQSGQSSRQSLPKLQCRSFKRKGGGRRGKRGEKERRCWAKQLVRLVWESWDYFPYGWNKIK